MSLYLGAEFPCYRQYIRSFNKNIILKALLLQMINFLYYIGIV